jgi:hypothetical protein
VSQNASIIGKPNRARNTKRALNACARCIETGPYVYAG